MQFPTHPTAEVAVRINAIQSPSDIAELAALAPVSSAIDAIVVPKFEDAQPGSIFHHMLEFISKNWAV